MGKRKPKVSRKSTEIEKSFPIIHPDACGIDIGAASIFVCVPADRDESPIREFETFTDDLHAMARWLKKCGITTIAMESTGVYWHSSFQILEEHGFEVKLVNAQHVKGVPGRKTDVIDCAWIQRLHSCGLLNGSFIPDDQVGQLRSYIRHRSNLFKRAADQINYVQKALELMNIKLPEVLSDVAGLTGSRIINAIIAGERDHQKLASYRDGRCKNDESRIAKALKGTWRADHLFSLKQSWEAYHFFHQQVVECEREIERLMSTFEKKRKPSETLTFEEAKEGSKTGKKVKKSIKRSYNHSPYSFDMRTYLHDWAGVDLCAIPGINENIASKILSEIGTDMSKWKTVKHFASWVGLCPGTKVSGGKRLSGRTKFCKNRVKEALRMAAYSLTFADCYLGAYYRRMRGKFGAPKAITMVAHKLARLVYRMIKTGTEYEELGADHYEKIHRERTEANLFRKAEELGFYLVRKDAA